MQKRFFFLVAASFCCLSSTFLACDNVPKHSESKVAQTDDAAKKSVDSVGVR